MDLLQDWRRRTAGAVAGAVIVPVALVVAALAVGVGGGGLGGLRALGQIVHGPPAPRVSATAGHRPSAATDAARLLEAVRPGRLPRRGTP
jgi:hypothetical protein